MAKTIEEEIIDYLKENDMYYIEEFDEEGFPIDDEAHDLIGDLTNAELCDILIESMEDIAEIQRKKDIEKACDAYCKMCDVNCDSGDTCNGLERFKKYMEEE